MSEQFIIETPENISFGYEVAGIGSRFLATLIDSLIQGSIYTVLLFTIVMFLSINSSSRLPPEFGNWMSAFILLILFLIQFGYFILFEITLGGQTPGKRLLGLRVIKENGYPLSPLDAIIRNIVRIIDFFPFAYGIGVIVMFLNERSKRLGDFAAGTLVVKVREQVKLSDLQTASVKISDVPELSGLEHLREVDIELIEAFLRRRNQLKSADAMAMTITRSILARMNSPETNAYANSMSAEYFLRRVAAAYRHPKSNRERKE